VVVQRLYINTVTYNPGNIAGDLSLDDSTTTSKENELTAESVCPYCSTAKE
jgi:hypothetical protein